MNILLHLCANISRVAWAVLQSHSCHISKRGKTREIRGQKRGIFPKIKGQKRGKNKGQPEVFDV